MTVTCFTELVLRILLGKNQIVCLNLIMNLVKYKDVVDDI